MSRFSGPLYRGKQKGLQPLGDPIPVKAFFFSAPYDKDNTGDGDFVHAMMKAFTKEGIVCEWIKGDLKLAATGAKLYEVRGKESGDVVQNLIKDGARDFQDFDKPALDWQKKPTIKPFNDLVNAMRADPERKQFVKNIISYILENTPAGLQPILEMQFRPPETGCLLLPEDLELFKAENIKVHMTVHEYSLNYTRPHLQVYSHEFFQHADQVFFLNVQDSKAAVESTILQKPWDPEGAVERFSGHLLIGKEFTVPSYPLASKAHVTQVPPTVKPSKESIDTAVERPPNISWFGMIRPWKGIEQASELAAMIQAKQLFGTAEEKKALAGMKVIIAGLPALQRTMEDLVRTAFLLNQAEMEELKKECETVKAANGDYPSKAWTSWWRQKITEFQTEAKKRGTMLPPVEIHLDVTEKENIELHQRCLYAYKPDSKGLAGNSSSIISEMAQKCIVFTKWGYCTPPEFLSGGDFEGAVILSKYMHGDTPTLNLSDPFYKQAVGAPSPQNVLDEIIRRQIDYQDHKKNSDIKNSMNYQTLAQSQKALEKYYNPSVIAKQHSEVIEKELKNTKKLKK